MHRVAHRGPVDRDLYGRIAVIARRLRGYGDRNNQKKRLFDTGSPSEKSLLPDTVCPFLFFCAIIAENNKVSGGRLISSLLTVVIMEDLIVSLDFLEFPVMYTCDGGNRSPSLKLKGLHATSVVIMVFNPFEKSCCSFTPWVIWNIPPLQVIPDGIPREGIVTAPIPAVQGVTDYGTIGYTSPCPPQAR